MDIHIYVHRLLLSPQIIHMEQNSEVSYHINFQFSVVQTAQETLTQQKKIQLYMKVVRHATVPDRI